MVNKSKKSFSIEDTVGVMCVWDGWDKPCQIMILSASLFKVQ